jgi:acetolactate synthase-1/2/3 large subunit
MTMPHGISDGIIERLRAAGVRALFGVPGGGGNLDLIDAARRAGLPFVLTATETAAALAALAQTEVTGTPGACLTTIGPGASSAMNGIACAWLERAPVIVFTDSQPGSSEHQKLDHAALFGSVVKMSASLTAEGGLDTVDRAIHEATTGRPGPVHIDCPGGVLGAAAAGSAGTKVPAYESNDDVVRRPELQFRPNEFRPNQELASLLAAARKPLLLIGLGARREQDAAAIRGLCRERGVPAMVTYKAKGVVADDDPWFAGVFTNGALERPLVDECDLLIGLGFDPVEPLPREWNISAPLVSLGPWPQVEEHIKPELQVVMSVVDAVEEIRRHLPLTAWSRRRVTERVEAQRRALDIQGMGMTAQDVVGAAASHLASTHRVTVDAGAHMFPATMLWPVSEPNGMLISNGLSTMGFALPAAVGAAIADRARPVVALTGDGGLLMCAGDLLTAARENLSIIVIVFNDASLSLIEIKQHARRLPPAGVALGGVDWSAMARSMGVAGFTASSTVDLESALAEAAVTTGPVLIDARIDNSNYGAVLRAVRG